LVVMPVARQEPSGFLQDRLIGLAGTADDSFRIGTDLIVVTHLAARLITVVDGVSVTGRHEGGYASVAASSDLAVAADRAQYGDMAGPCLEALEADHPAAVPDIAATSTWPGFRDAAARLGLRSSLSIPLFAGSGATIASLNLYCRQIGVMSTLTTAVRAAYDPDTTEDWDHAALDPGSRELVAGLMGAVALRTMIQRAIGVLASTGETSADRAYLTLCTRAAESSTSLTEVAAQVIEQNQA
jgi:hypothetical protein